MKTEIKKRKLLIGIITGLFVALLSLLTINAATVNGVYTLTGPASTEVGGTVSVAVKVTNITGGTIGGVSGEISWDKEYLQLVSATGITTPFTVEFLNETNMFTGFTMRATGFTADTTILTLKFKALKEGTTKVELSAPDLSDTAGKAAGATVANAYSVNIGPAKSTNARLGSLTVTGYNYTPAFNGGTANYSLTVPNDVSSVNVSATCEDPKATMSWTSGKAGANTLVVGSNKIVVRCTAESGVGANYTLTITRSAPDIVLSSDNALKNLSVSGYTISPSFSTDTLEYSLTIPYDASSVIVNAEANDPKASVAVNGATGLQVGENIVEVVVTAENGTPKTYKIKVTREEKVETPVELDGDATLSKLDLGGFTLTPTFKPDVNVYSITVQSTVDGLKVDAIPTSSKSTVSVSGNLNWSYGMNTVTITVTAENGNKNTYTVNVKRKEPTQTSAPAKSGDSYLTSLTVKGAELTPTFDKDRSSYEITLPYEVETLDISYITSDKNAKVEILDNEPLQVNQKQTIRIKVTAEDGSVREYTINATRSALTSNTYLKELSIGNFLLAPLFDKETLNYKTIVKSNTDSLDLTALAENPNAKVEIFGNEDFNEGTNIVMIRVTDENGFNRVYQIEVEKPAWSFLGMSLGQFLMLTLLGLGILSLFLIMLLILKKNKKEEPAPAVAAPAPQAPTIDFKPEFNFGSRNGTDDDVVYPGGILNQGNGSQKDLPGNEPKKLVGTYSDVSYTNVDDDDENAPFDYYDETITKAELISAIKEGMETKNPEKLKMLMKQDELNQMKKEIKRKEAEKRKSSRSRDYDE